MTILKSIYNNMWNNAIELFQKGEFECDPLINNQEDRRRGITLIAKVDEQTLKNVAVFGEEIKNIAPNQYYYKKSELHITILPIISCYEGFQLSNINIEEYVTLIKKSLIGISPFEIKFNGITASSSCIILQGFPESDELTVLRDNIRKNFKNSPLEQTIDKRYTLLTAHSTLIRFMSKPQKSKLLVSFLQKNRERDFGSTVVNRIELVYNNWYHSSSVVKTLADFRLGEI